MVLYCFLMFQVRRHNDLELEVMTIKFRTELTIGLSN